jgi:hypothetical protein
VCHYKEDYLQGLQLQDNIIMVTKPTRPTDMDGHQDDGGGGGCAHAHSAHARMEFGFGFDITIDYLDSTA